MSDTQPETTQEEIYLTILANLMALNIFIQIKFGDKDAELLEDIIGQVRKTMEEDGVGL